MYRSLGFGNHLKQFSKCAYRFHSANNVLTTKIHHNLTELNSTMNGKDVGKECVSKEQSAYRVRAGRGFLGGGWCSAQRIQILMLASGKHTMIFGFGAGSATFSASP